ncbi:extracellular solute-binding protein [Streptomyces sp. M3]|uniref:extracellular solute-binding protein n=1 Tax=Streptomyces sp. M3 TaxID=295102 RepID=UPI00240E1B12|nr:extracellular solute-binding protein [Streptomyces sp. M3]
MILYNKKIFEKAGLDPEHPRLATYSQFLETSRTLVHSGAAKAAIWPAPSSEFFQSWLDFYPAFAAQSGGKQLVEDGEPQFDSPAGPRWPRSGASCTRRSSRRRRRTPGTP